MLFSLHGEQGKGIASVEAVKEANLAQATRPTITLLAVDVTESKSDGSFDEPILVEGTHDRLHVRGQLREYFVGLREGSKSLPAEFTKA